MSISRHRLNYSQKYDPLCSKTCVFNLFVLFPFVGGHADRGKGESSKTTDFRGSDVEEVDLLNVSFSEMELGTDIDVPKLF